MSFDLEKIIESKRHFRRELFARSISEKLEILEELRERSLAVRAAKERMAAREARGESTSGSSYA